VPAAALQVPVDTAFLVIATLSQGAWIFRWSLDSSWLGIAMVALMALNATMMQVGAMGWVGGRAGVCWRAVVLDGCV
jgi:hypothetical protein